MIPKAHRRTRNASIAIVLTLGAVALAGCTTPTVNQPGSTGSAGDTGSSKGVEMKDIKFAPPLLEVTVGSTVAWTNRDAVSHTVTPTDKNAWGTSGSGDDQSQWLKQDQSWSFKFTKAGTYEHGREDHRR